MKKVLSLLFLFSFSLTACVDFHIHMFSDEWSKDRNYHWHESTCNHFVISDKSEHTFLDNVVEQNYEHGGYVEHICTVCGYSYKENETIAIPIIIFWNNYDGKVLYVDNNVPYGTMPSYNGRPPTRPSDSEHSYTFSGWSPTVVPATESTTYVAQYTSS